MTGSTPSDLAVTFRSVPRRVREALGDRADAHAWTGHGLVAEVIAESARVLGTGADPAVIADALESRHVSDWTDSDLDAMRALALRLGALVREAEAWSDGPPG